MAEQKQIRKPKKKKKKQDEAERLSRDKQEKLKELDQYIDEVLQEAGEDFLERFKQIEGQ